MGKGNFKFYKAITKYRTVMQHLRAITKGICHSRTEPYTKAKLRLIPKTVSINKQNKSLDELQD